MEQLSASATADIIQALVWITIALGGALIAIALWIGKQLGNRLAGIETELRGTNHVLTTIERDIRNDIGSLDRRLVVVESTYCGNDRRVAK